MVISESAGDENNEFYRGKTHHNKWAAFGAYSFTFEIMTFLRVKVEKVSFTLEILVMLLDGWINRAQGLHQ